MLQIKEVSITYKNDFRLLISKLSLVLNRGDKVALIGEEGNGKSTLMKLIYDEELVEHYIEYSGDIIKDRCVLGYLEQEIDSRETDMSVYEFLTKESGFYEMGQRELAEMANQLGLSPDFLYTEQKMKTLSGGERIKLQIVRILSRRPDILLLDEPSNDLDLEMLEWMESFIQNWEGAVLFISHDETLLERTANRVVHLESLKKKREAKHTVVNVGYMEYTERRRHQLAKQEQAAKKERSEYRAQQERFRRIEQKVQHQQAVVSRQDPHGAALLKKKMKTVKSLEHRLEREAGDMTELPDVEEAMFFKFHLGDKIPGGKTILDMKQDMLFVGKRLLAEHIELRVKGVEKICIIGKNGVGKTTLLKRIAEQLLERNDMQAAYMPQDYMSRMDFDKTPVDVLSVIGDKEEQTKIRSFLGSLRFTREEMEHPIRALSGGQKAKLYLLQISMQGANVLILDEPTRNFSPLSNPVIRQLLRDFEGTIISVSHDRKFIEEVCDTIYELSPDGLRRL